MAVTITDAQIAVAIRAATAEDDVPGPIQVVLAILIPAATACVLDYAPKAPDALHNAAVVRLTGWLYDADPTDPQISQAIRVSGAGPLLSAYRVHRAGIIGDTAGGVPPSPPAAGLPPAPAAGSFILTVQDGVLSWVAFPLPS